MFSLYSPDKVVFLSALDATCRMMNGIRRPLPNIACTTKAVRWASKTTSPIQPKPSLFINQWTRQNLTIFTIKANSPLFSLFSHNCRWEFIKVVVTPANNQIAHKPLPLLHKCYIHPNSFASPYQNRMNLYSWHQPPFIINFTQLRVFNRGILTQLSKF